MKTTGIFFGSRKGVTKAFAEKIAAKIAADVYDIKDTDVSKIAEYKTVILMTPSYEFGSAQEDWGAKIKLLHTVDFSEKNIALVAVGSVKRHGDSFCNGAMHFYDKLALSNARFIGATCVKSGKYGEFTGSRYMQGMGFWGLALDADDEEAVNDARIDTWASSIKKYLA